MARSELEAAGYSPAALATLRRRHAWSAAIGAAHRDVVFAGFEAKPVGAEGVITNIALLIVAEPIDGSYATRLALDNHMDEPYIASLRPIDVIDVDRDSVLELVIASAHGEAWEYSAYRRYPRGWKKIYEGAGGGC